MRVAEYWRLKEQRYILEGAQDKSTEAVTFPPRPVQPRTIQTYEFNTQPEAYAWSTSDMELVEAQ